jgi:hypothetical protein
LALSWLADIKMKRRPDDYLDVANAIGDAGCLLASFLPHR